jgi:replication fork clamp-binding protein CrfC
MMLDDDDDDYDDEEEEGEEEEDQNSQIYLPMISLSTRADWSSGRKGDFDNVHNQSLLTTPLATTGQALARGARFMAAASCSDLDCLQRLNTTAILHRSKALSSETYHFWQPVVDGVLVPRPIAGTR